MEEHRKILQVIPVFRFRANLPAIYKTVSRVRYVSVKKGQRMLPIALIYPLYNHFS